MLQFYRRYCRSNMSLGSVSEKDSGISDHEEESQYIENKRGLSQDLRFLAGMPELCDVMFIVGEEKTAIYGVKAVLAIRSRVFYKMLYGPKSALGSRQKALPPSTGGTVSKKIQKMISDATPSPLRSSVRGGIVPQSTSNGQQRMVVTVEEFEPDVFKQLLEYIHTGAVTLVPRTLLGLMNAADHFSLEDLRRACAEFSQKCIKLDTVCSLLVTAERYIQYKSTKIFVQRVLEFVDSNAEDVLRLGEFVHLPRHVVELILSREDLQAASLTKYRAAERWSRHYVMYNPHATMTELMRPFVHYVHFQSIPTSILMKEIRPLGIVPDTVLMNALAFQADPGCVADISSSQLDVDRLSPRSRSRARLFQLCSTSSHAHEDVHVGPTQIGRLSSSAHPTLNIAHTNNRSRSVDRNYSTGSSGYESFVHTEEDQQSDEIYSTVPLSPPANMKTIVHIDDPLDYEDNKSKSYSDLSTVRIEYKL